MDIYRAHQLIGLVLISLFVCHKIYKTYGLIEALFIGYCLLSSAVLFQSQVRFWNEAQIRIDATSAASFAKIIGLSFIALYYDELRTFLHKSIDSLVLISSIILLINPYSIFNASSADAAMIAMMYPFLCLRPESTKEMDNQKALNFCIIFIPLMAIIKTSGSTSYFVLLGGVLGYVIYRKAYKYLLLSIPVLVIGTYMNGETFLNSSTRLEEWDRLFAWWFNNANFYLGSGIGSYEWLGPLIQISAGNKVNIYTLMHNDYLQLFFEGGFIGLILGLTLWLKVGLAAQKSWVFPCFAAISVCMLTYYPMRWFLSQIFMLIVCCEVLWRKK